MTENANVNLIKDDFCVDAMVDTNSTDDEICLIAPADAHSLFLYTCGKGSNSNFHNMSSIAPTTLSDIDPNVWERCYFHFWMAGMTSTQSSWATFFYTIAMVSFVLLAFFNPNQDYAAMFCLLMNIALFGYLYESWQDHRRRGEKYRKIVMKMTPTFQAQGYHVEYIEPPRCTYDRVFTGRWLRFTRVGYPLSPCQQTGRIDEEQPQSINEATTFKPEDWTPLEGTWELMHPSDMKGYIPWLVQTQSMTWTFQHTTSEATFESFIESQANICCSMIPRESTIQRFTLHGNGLHLELKGSLSMKGQARKYLEGEVYVPIPMGDRSVRSLYKKRQNHILLVQSPEQTETPKILKLFEFEFDEDVPNDKLLVSGALDHLTEDELQAKGAVLRLLMEFQEPTRIV